MAHKRSCGPRTNSAGERGVSGTPCQSKSMGMPSEPTQRPDRHQGWPHWVWDLSVCLTGSLSSLSVSIASGALISQRQETLHVHAGLQTAKGTSRTISGFTKKSRTLTDKNSRFCFNTASLVSSCQRVDYITHHRTGMSLRATAVIHSVNGRVILFNGGPQQSRVLIPDPLQ